MKKTIILIIIIFNTIVLCFSQSNYRLQLLYNEGFDLYNKQNLHEALYKWQKGLEIAKEIRDIKAILVFESALGLAYESLGYFQQALIHTEEALRISRELGIQKAIFIHLFKIGYIYQNLNDYKKAIDYFEMALRSSAEFATKDTIIGILSGLGILNYELSNYDKAIHYHQKSLAIAKEYGKKIFISSEMGNLARAYVSLSEYQSAMNYYEEALEIDREIDNKKGIINNINGLGIVYMDLNDFRMAILYYEESLILSKELKDNKAEAIAYNNLGHVYRILGDFSKALDYYENSRKIYKELGDNKGLSRVFNGIGLVYRDFGDLQKSLLIHEKSLKINRGIGSKEGIGNSLNNIGLVLWDLGEYQKALKYQKDALNIYRNINSPKGIGSALLNIGNVYSNLGDYQKAIDYYVQALEISQKNGDKNEEAKLLNNIGSVYSFNNELKKAFSYYERSMKIRKELGMSTERIEVNMAFDFLEKGNIEEAGKIIESMGNKAELGILNIRKREYRRAIEYFNYSLKHDLKNHISTNLFLDYCGLGLAYKGLGDFKKAIEYFKNAIILIEEQREKLSEREKSKYFSAKFRAFNRTIPYEGMVESLIALNLNDEAFFYSENIKARILAETIAKNRSILFEAIPSNFITEEESYIKKITGLRREMDKLYINNAMNIFYEKQKQLKNVKEKQGDFIRKLRKLYPEYVSINYPQPLKPSEIALKNNESLVEFKVTDQKTFVFLIRAGQIKVKEIQITRKNLQNKVMKYRNNFYNILSYNDLYKYKVETGLELYSLLLGEILYTIPENSSIIIVPDEFLAVLPFESLIIKIMDGEKMRNGEYGPFPFGVEYLGDKYSISYAQSATTLTLLRTLNKETTKIEKSLTVCDPIFSIDDTRINELEKTELDEEHILLMSAIIDWKTMGIAGLKLRGEAQRTLNKEESIFPRLERTKKIAKGMKELFGNDATILIGESAKEQEIRDRDLTPYKYVIFATHGILDRTIPWIQEPALVLTQIGNSKGYDGFLTMTEVMGLNLNAKVVALTACETGVGENIEGEGVMAMGRAFQYAGAESVLMSLWSVAEDATVLLTNTFFKNLKNDKEPKEALILAKEEIRKKGYEHPFYWSGFILVGD